MGYEDIEVGGGQRTKAFFEWVNTKILWITIGIAVITLISVPLAANRSEDDPNFDPSGEIYDTLDLTEARFQNSSPLADAVFIVEGRGTDALTQEVLYEVKVNSDALRSDAELNADLGTRFRSDLEEEVNGVFSLADKVDEALEGGLATATDGEVKVALAEILGDGVVGSPLRDTLSQLATSRIAEVDGVEIVVWAAPAFSTAVVIDLTNLGGRDTETFGEIGPEGQEYLRDVQSVLQGEQASYTMLGVAIDGDLTAEEQLAESSPYILLSVVGIMVLVGALLRSYWAAAMVAVGLAITMLWYNAVLTVLGFEGGMLLGFIAPISVIAFGVDFFVHASGRAREEQVAGFPRIRAYPRGLTLVFPALTLAVISSAAAFISNGVAGIQAIVQFGIGTAIALLIGYLILGLITPKWLFSIEDSLGQPPLDRGRMIPYKIGFVVMTLVAGSAVTFSVVLPPVGFGLLAILFLPFFVYLPMRWTRRIYRRAAEAGRPTGDVIKGAGHGFKAAGDLVHFLARWRVITIPVTFALAIVGAVAFTQVDSEFEFSDFFSEDSDFIQSVELLDTHFSDTGGGGSGFVYVEGDLTPPATLLALEEVVVDLDAAEAGADPGYLSRDLNGALTVEDNAVTVVRTAVESPASLGAAGIVVVDDDGDGLPDSADQIRAIYDLAFSQGIRTDEGVVAYPSDSVTELIWTDGAGNYATLVQVGIPTFTEDAIILDARDALDDAAASLEASSSGATLAVISVSGETITQQDSLAAFTDAMLLALPVALILCALLAAVFMRSAKYGITAVTPILLVVGWVYGFMFLADYKINVVTATIAAIAVGVGIDYSTHFTMRFREEFEDEPSRFPALRRAGEGTGGALAVSALSSVIGFSVMAFAPMPIFVTFGTLTAVMIVFSLLVSLMVLPSLLLIVTRRRTGAERQHLLDLTGIAPGEYDPHSRETAVHGQEPAH
ncbi:MAG: efflux RND transporter permease subunit [Acidimicrobiales bacterium]